MGNNYWADTGQNAAVLDGKIFGFSYWNAAIPQSQINSLLIKSISQGNNNKGDFISYANEHENLAAAWIFRDSPAHNYLISLIIPAFNGSIVNAEWNNDVPIPKCGSGLIWNTIDDCVYENQVEFLYDIFSFTDSISLSSIDSNIFLLGIKNGKMGI